MEPFRALGPFHSIPHSSRTEHTFRIFGICGVATVIWATKDVHLCQFLMAHSTPLDGDSYMVWASLGTFFLFSFLVLCFYVFMFLFFLFYFIFIIIFTCLWFKKCSYFEIFQIQKMFKFRKCPKLKNVKIQFFSEFDKIQSLILFKIENCSNMKLFQIWKYVQIVKNVPILKTIRICKNV
jgi:hypothetical protein